MGYAITFNTAYGRGKSIVAFVVLVLLWHYDGYIHVLDLSRLSDIHANIYPHRIMHNRCLSLSISVCRFSMLMAESLEKTRPEFLAISNEQLLELLAEKPKQQIQHPQPQQHPQDVASTQCSAPAMFQ